MKVALGIDGVSQILSGFLQSVDGASQPSGQLFLIRLDLIPSHQLLIQLLLTITQGLVQTGINMVSVYYWYTCTCS